ncbi:MAG: hypothetical protein ACNYWM_07205 [Methanosarcinales archaeon]
MKKLIMLIALIGLVSMVQSVSAMGIGVAPSEVSIENALRGGEAETTVTIFNTGSQDDTFLLSASGDISEWVSYYNKNDPETIIETIDIPGSDKVQVLAVFQIPADAQNENYYGSLDITTAPKNTSTEGTGQHLIVGASSKITIAVTGEQKIDGKVIGITIADTEHNNPLKVKVIFENTGNVIVNPKIDVIIYQNENEVHRYVHQSTEVKPTLTETIIAIWNTTSSNVPDDYIANVTVSLEGRTIVSNNVPFKILPFGSLTRQGNLTEIIVEKEPVIGTPLRIGAVFKNTGMIESSAKFSGEVYRDGDFIDTIMSDELLVEINKEVMLTSYFKPESAGDYLIKGKVTYAGKETPVKEVTFIVPKDKSMPGFGGISGVIMVITLFILRRKIRKN